MIVYNVNRQWFTHKDQADAYRKAQGIRPSNATPFKVTIETREELATLLNALCEPTPETVKAMGTLLVDRAYVEPQRAVPDYVPLFLIDKDQREAIKADREARGWTPETAERSAEADLNDRPINR